ncbi:hypothetical protein [Synechocystis sp. LKSZ1]|uniref:hypothetical protein n=1 Tax=Synechocystis sp. LKSZ1 TaxID=3144951 RepID=UPI00336BBF11
MGKKLLLLAGGLLLVSAAIIYYFWRQATTIPDWYQREMALPSSLASPINPETLLQQKLQAAKEQSSQNPGSVPTQLDIRLKPQELNQVLQAELAQISAPRHLPTALLPQLKTQVKADQLEVGTVISPQSLQGLNLGPREQALLEKLRQQFPQLQTQDLYLGIAGKPQVQQNTLILPVDSTIKVGQLRFTLAEMAQQLQIPPERLQKGLALPMGQLNLRNLQLNNNEVILQVDSPSHGAN